MTTCVTTHGAQALKVNGKPLFPITARHMPIGGSAKLLSDIGFTAMRWTPFGRAKYNIESYEGCSYEPPQDLGSLMFYPYVFTCGDLSRNAHERRRQLSNLVSAVKDHPNLLCYEQVNEPAFTWMADRIVATSPEGMVAGSNLIRKLDPDHPIRIGHMCANLVSTLKKYNAATDIISCNPYCISAPNARRFVGTRADGYLTDHADRTLSVVGRYTDKMKRVADTQSVWMQIQGSSNENWYNPNHTPETRDHGVYNHHLRYPTYWEMRFMAFNAIIHGATGLEWMLIRHHVDSPTFHDVKMIIGQLRDLHGVLASPTIPHDFDIEYSEMGFSDWDGVEALVKRHGGRIYILSANTQFDPMIATFRTLPEGIGKKVEVLNEQRTIEVGTDGFTDRFQPYEVHIYASI